MSALTAGHPTSMTTLTNADWPRLITEYTTELRARSQSPESIRTRLSYVRRWARQHHPDSTRSELVAWLANDAWAPATRKSAQSSLRGFYGWMVTAGHLEHSPAATLDPVRVPKRLPRPASEDQVKTGLESAKPDRALMVRLAATLGLRRAEIARLRRDDVTPWGLHVRGKGGKDRVVPLPPALREELEVRQPGWLFPGRFTGHIHPSTVQVWIRESSGISPHPHRHRFATRAYAGTQDVFAVQQVLGHESAETTQIYVKVAALNLQAAVMAAAA